MLDKELRQEREFQEQDLEHHDHQQHGLASFVERTLFGISVKYLSVAERRERGGVPRKGRGNERESCKKRESQTEEIED